MGNEVEEDNEVQNEGAKREQWWFGGWFGILDDLKEEYSKVMGLDTSAVT